MPFPTFPQFGSDPYNAAPNAAPNSQMNPQIGQSFGLFNNLLGQSGLLGGGSSGGGFGGLLGGGGDGGGSAMGGMGPAGLFAALIGTGKNLEYSNANNAVGKTGLAFLGPSFSQVMKDPVGMGLPTLFGASFLTPFTASKASQDTRPEWSHLFSLGS